jgi:hypothetical protein
VEENQILGLIREIYYHDLQCVIILSLSLVTGFDVSIGISFAKYGKNYRKKLIFSPMSIDF